MLHPWSQNVTMSSYKSFNSYDFLQDFADFVALSDKAIMISHRIIEIIQLFAGKWRTKFKENIYRGWDVGSNRVMLPFHKNTVGFLVVSSNKTGIMFYNLRLAFLSKLLIFTNGMKFNLF